MQLTDLRYPQRHRIHWGVAAFGLICLAGTGCVTTSVNEEVARIEQSEIPRELQKVTHPTYRVEPPDILLIEAVNNIRPPEAPLQAGDEINIRLGNPPDLVPLEVVEGDVLDGPGVAPQNGPPRGQEPPMDDLPPRGPETPLTQFEILYDEYHIQQEVRNKFLDGPFRIQPDGYVDLGPHYGKVYVAGLTVDKAEEAIRDYLTRYNTRQLGVDGQPTGLRDPQVTVTMPDIIGKQQISGEHLVRPDGTISLGIYGSVHVAGRTLREVKYIVESYLSQWLVQPEVNVDVLAYNSKVYYVIIDGGGFGEQVVRIPCTGNETVLDAISNVDGLSEVSSKKIWVARPSPPELNCAQIMDVHWNAITREGIATTNYQILPGDRIYIESDCLIKTDNFLAKLTSPFERVFGFILLGHGTVRTLQFGHLGGGGGGFGGFGGTGGGSTSAIITPLQ